MKNLDYMKIILQKFDWEKILLNHFSIENLENLVEEIKKENAEPRKNNLNKIDKFYFEI